MIKLEGRISVKRLYGKINLVPSDGSSGGPLQAKTVYPSHSQQVIAPDEDYYGLVAVTVEPVPKLPACVTEITTDNSRKNLAEEVVNIGTDASVFLVEEATEHFLYNSVRLPKIPEFEEYPHAVIIKAVDSTDYRLYLSPGVFYTDIYRGRTRLAASASGGYGFLYRDGFSDWLCNYEGAMTTTELFYNEVSCEVIWSKRDIPAESATSTTIYFAGSEPVQTE